MSYVFGATEEEALKNLKIEQAQINMQAADSQTLGVVLAFMREYIANMRNPYRIAVMKTIHATEKHFGLKNSQ